MRKLIIAFGIIAVLAVFSVQGWAAENPLYGCYQNNKQVRVVGAAGDCLPSETVVALNKSDSEATTSEKATQEPQEKTEKSPVWPYGSIFGYGSLSYGSP